MLMPLMMNDGTFEIAILFWVRNLFVKRNAQKEPKHHSDYLACLVCGSRRVGPDAGFKKARDLNRDLCLRLILSCDKLPE